MAIRRLKASIKVDVSSILRLKKNYTRKRLDLFRAMATRHEEMLRRRFYANAAGTGGWPPLSEKYYERKVAFMENEGLSGDPGNILRLSDTLVMSIGYKISDNGYKVGFISSDGHPYSGLSTKDLAYAHHIGARYNPPRPVVRKPTEGQRRTLIKIAQTQFNDVIRKSNGRS